MYITHDEELNASRVRALRPGKTVGPAVIILGGGPRLQIDNVAEADALIAAACEAKRLLGPAAHVKAAPIPAPCRAISPAVESAPNAGQPVPGQPGLVIGHCGHAMAQGAFARGFAGCRSCLSDQTAEGLSFYDRAARTPADALPPNVVPAGTSTASRM